MLGFVYLTPTVFTRNESHFTRSCQQVISLTKLYHCRFGKHFELPLLAQSVLMIFAMMAMVEICVRVRNRSEIVQPRQHHLRGE